MEILLINPPSKASNPIMPLGLAYLAVSLENAGIPVEVIDAWAEGYSFERLERELARKNPDIVGITMMSPFYGAAMRTVDAARANTKAKIVVGGAHPSAVPAECLRDNSGIDFAVIGEGERTLVELAKAIFEGRKDTSAIKGLAFRQGGKIITTLRSDAVEDLDILSPPARHLFPTKKYRTHPPYGKENPYMTLITSRGCPFQCTYCSKSVFGSKYRFMSPAKVLWEIKHIKKNYGVKELHFYDDDFTMDMNRAEEICDLLKAQNVDISWSCTTRVDLVNRRLLEKMKASGCWLISYGIESADEGVLKKIKKGYTTEDVKRAFSLTKNVGIRTAGFFMVGLPGETRRSLKKTIEFSLDLDPDFVSWGITALYPGSPLYDSLNLRYHPEIKKGHASGSPYGDGYALIYEDTLSRRELEEYVKEANRLFYLRPLYLLRFVFKIRSFREFLHYLKGGFKTLFWMLRGR